LASDRVLLSVRFPFDPELFGRFETVEGTRRHPIAESVRLLVFAIAESLSEKAAPRRRDRDALTISCY
jgi:hypothetical protein